MQYIINLIIQKVIATLFYYSLSDRSSTYTFVKIVNSLLCSALLLVYSVYTTHFIIIIHIIDMFDQEPAISNSIQMQEK